MNRWTTFLLAGTVTCASAADIDSTSLLARVRSKVLDSARTIPRYVCRQNTERQTFVPNSRPSKAACGKLPEPASSELTGLDLARTGRGGVRGFSLLSTDRANLDVMLAEGTELFSWPGGASFGTNDPGDLLGGGFSGNGDFSSFLINAFNHAIFEYLGTCEGVSCVRFQYDVPVSVSQYVVKTALNQVSLGYHGTIDIDPQAADLLAMTVVPTDLRNDMRVACDLRTRMTYTRTTMNASEFTIPESVTKEYLAANGAYFTNWVRYTGCRQYTAESTLTFGDDGSRTNPPDQNKIGIRLPPTGTQLQVKLTSKIDSDLSSAGDILEATLVRAVPGTAGRMIPAGTVVRGHLAQVEKIYVPKPAVALAMRFDTIVLDGAPIPLNLAPVGKQDLRGRAVFNFPLQRVILDSKFISQWRVRSP